MTERKEAMMLIKRFSVRQVFDDERGSALIISIFMLIILTIIGIATTNTSMTEILISAAEKDRERCFYVAEAGVEHARGMLTGLFAQRNSAKIASTGTADWDFALDGTEAGVNAATGLDFDNGTTWISNGDGGSGYTYNVTLWNNADGGSATDDEDGLIYVRSISSGPNGGSASIEIIMRGWVSADGSVTGYAAQAGAGSAKAYVGDDLNAITDFSTQL